MEELLELRTAIKEHRYIDALWLVDEIETMSKEDKLNKMGSYLAVLLMHLIKQHAEKRSTRSWERSIKNAVYEINRTNKRRKAGGHYAGKTQLKELIEEVYLHAVTEATFEAFEGQYTEKELSEKINEREIKQKALALIVQESEIPF